MTNFFNKIAVKNKTSGAMITQFYPCTEIPEATFLDKTEHFRKCPEIYNYLLQGIPKL